MRVRAASTMTVVVAVTMLAVCAHASDGDFIWAKAMGGTGSDWGQGVAVDEAGNIYTTGTFQGTADFDPSSGNANMTSAGEGDVFISKLNSAGEFLWSKQMGGTGDDRGWGIALDNEGNVYVTGSFTGVADFDPGTATFNLTAAGSCDVFVSKLDSVGSLLWAKAVGGTCIDSGKGIAIDAAHSVYVTGCFYGAADFDPGPGVLTLTPGNIVDAFVLKLNSAGDLLWAKATSGTLDNFGDGIALDGAGHVFITGSLRGTADFDPGPGVCTLTSTGSNDIFVSGLDSAGAFLWARAMGGTEWDRGNSIVVDDDGNICTVGDFTGTADLDPGPQTFNLTSAGSSDIFVSKLDSAGTFMWAKAMGGTESDQGDGITADSGGAVYVTGYFQSTADFEPGPGTFNLLSSGQFDTFISKFDKAGNFVWARAIGGTGWDRGNGIATDSGSTVYVAGLFQSTVDFDPGPGTLNLAAVGDYDVFVSKLSALDVAPPSAIIITPWTSGPTSADHVGFTVVFDEPVQSFDEASDVDISHTGSAASTGVSITGSCTMYTVMVTGISGAGTLSLCVRIGSDVEDMTGNPLASSVTSTEVVIDPLAPGMPLVAWPLGLALLAVGTVATASHRTGRK